MSAAPSFSQHGVTPVDGLSARGRLFDRTFFQTFFQLCAGATDARGAVTQMRQALARRDFFASARAIGRERHEVLAKLGGPSVCPSTIDGRDRRDGGAAVARQALGRGVAVAFYILAADGKCAS